MDLLFSIFSLCFAIYVSCQVNIRPSHEYYKKSVVLEDEQQLDESIFDWSNRKLYDSNGNCIC